MDRLSEITNYLRDSATVKIEMSTSKDVLIAIDTASEQIFKRMLNGNKLMICGNGGSAADSQHIAAEFTSLLSQDNNRAGLPAMALTTDTSFITAYTNDFNFAGIFKRQIEALGKSGDVLLAISTSGNSDNVVRGAIAAKERNMFRIGLTGAESSDLERWCDITIKVPSNNVQHIQEAHITIGHILCEHVEKRILEVTKFNTFEELWPKEK